jgi:hypothetical protein
MPITMLEVELNQTSFQYRPGADNGIRTCSIVTPKFQDKSVPVPKDDPLLLVDSDVWQMYSLAEAIEIMKNIITARFSGKPGHGAKQEDYRGSSLKDKTRVLRLPRHKQSVLIAAMVAELNYGDKKAWLVSAAPNLVYDPKKAVNAKPVDKEDAKKKVGKDDVAPLPLIAKKPSSEEDAKQEIVKDRPAGYSLHLKTELEHPGQIHAEQIMLWQFWGLWKLAADSKKKQPWLTSGNLLLDVVFYLDGLPKLCPGCTEYWDKQVAPFVMQGSTYCVIR